ncbi:hypothetical protein [Bradyrhizobium sp. UFLA06-06]
MAASEIPACLPPRAVTPPKHKLPPKACDTHAHVFGPADRFPYAGDRSYTPPDAPLATYLGMLDALGFARGVLVPVSYTHLTLPTNYVYKRQSAACASTISSAAGSCTIAAAFP